MPSLTVDYILGDALMHSHSSGDIVDLTTTLDPRYVNITGDTMGGALTITPLANGTSILDINQADGTPVFDVDTINRKVVVSSSATGQSTIHAGLIVNNDSGNGAINNFQVNTAGAVAILVDALANKMNLGVPVGLGIASPLATLHLKAGTATANTAPIKLTTGVSLSSTEAGVIEFTTDDLFFTITTGTARKRLLMADATAGLTFGKIPVATTNGRLTDVAPQTELTDELTTITFTAPGTPDYAIQDLTNSGGYGFVTKDEGNSVLAVVANLQARVNEIETKLVTLGLLADAD